jgi:hypothetical protein
VVAPFDGETERDDLVEREGSVERSERRRLTEEELLTTGISLSAYSTHLVQRR